MILEGDMEFRLRKTSNPFESKTVTINSLEDLENLWEEYGREDIIINFCGTIEIYDDYRE